MSDKKFSPIHFETFFHETREYVCKWTSYADGGSYAFGKSPTGAEWNALQQARQYFEVGAQTRKRNLFGKEKTDEDCKKFYYDGSGAKLGIKHPLS